MTFGAVFPRALRPAFGPGLAAGGGAASPLLTGLVSYWKLDEASGTRSDSHGSNNLADNNTVTQAAGKIGSAGQFVRANSEYLSIASNASLQTGDIDFTITGWIYLDDATVSGTAYGMLSKWTGASNEYMLWHFYGYLSLVVRNAANTGNGFLQATTFGNLSAATWYWICAYHDAANDVLAVGVNNVFNTTAYSAGVHIGAAPFEIGRWDSDGYWWGRVDEVGFWKRMLTPTERGQLYASGSGLAYPFS